MNQRGLNTKASGGWPEVNRRMAWRARINKGMRGCRAGRCARIQSTAEQRRPGTRLDPTIFNAMKPLYLYGLDRQARTGDTVLVKIREMTGRSQTLPWWLGAGEEDDRKYIGSVELQK